MATWKRCILLLLLLVVGQLLVTWAIELPSAPVLSNDSGFYLSGADRFPQLIPKQRPYLGMILFLRMCGLLGAAPWVALLGNASAVWLASLALWQIASHYAGARAGWIAASIWLLNPLAAQWTRYVLTEPLFYSAVIFWLWLALFRPGWPLLLFSAAGATLRPNGFTLLASAIAWVVLINTPDRKRTGLLLLVGLLALLGTVVVIAPMISPVAIKVPQLITNGTVIHSHPELALSMDAPLAVPRLFAARLGWEFVQLRPWYSLRFNAFIALFMPCFYALALRGALLTRGTRLFWAVVVISAPSLLVISSTWAIHEGRFAWWVLVAWIPWVAIGFQQANNVVQQNRRYAPAKS
jgi:hypothetical protein